MTALGIVLFALLILVSVCLHEAGHMATAKAFGMKVTRYFVGFGPTLWSFRRGETEYGIKAIPAGGFVKIVGMTPQDDDVEPGDEHRAMWRFPVWKRTIVMAAGSFTHFIIAFILLWIAFSFVATTNPKAADLFNNPGNATPYVTVEPCVSTSSTSTATCDSSNSSPATLAGLKNGDKIVALNAAGAAGTTMVTPVSTYDEVRTAIRAEPIGGKVSITYVRDGKTYTSKPVSLVKGSQPPLNNPNGKPVPTNLLGISIALPPGMPETVTYGPVNGVTHAGSFYGTMFNSLGGAIARLPGRVPGLVSAIEGKPRDVNGPISVVGASELGGQSLQQGDYAFFIILAAELNIFVGVFNLFPLLPLDGGHIAIAWYERIREAIARRRRKPLPARVDYYKLMPLTYVVIVILGGFSLLTILADVVNPITLPK